MLWEALFEVLKEAELLSDNSLFVGHLVRFRLSFAMKVPDDMFLKPFSSPERL